MQAWKEGSFCSEHRACGEDGHVLTMASTVAEAAGRYRLGCACLLLPTRVLGGVRTIRAGGVRSSVRGGAARAGESAMGLRVALYARGEHCYGNHVPIGPSPQRRARTWELCVREYAATVRIWERCI
eukprot:1580605-Rhodomonas_salina.1